MILQIFCLVSKIKILDIFSTCKEFYTSGNLYAPSTKLPHSQKKIGEGGMETVYRAVGTRTGQAVAIKELWKDMATPEMITRFKREARRCAL